MKFFIEYPGNARVIEVEAENYQDALNKSTLFVADKLATLTKEFSVLIEGVGNAKKCFWYTMAGEFQEM